MVILKVLLIFSEYIKNTSPCYTPQYPCVTHAWTNFLSYPPTFPEVLAGSFTGKQMYGCSCVLATVLRVRIRGAQVL